MDISVCGKWYQVYHDNLLALYAPVFERSLSRLTNHREVSTIDIYPGVMRKLYGYLTGHRERGARTLPLNQQYWASSGSTSSKTGGWYLSLLRAVFRYFGSMKTLKAPEFFEAVARLLTQGVGSSIGASTASFTYLSYSCFSFDFSPAGTLRVGIIKGLASSSVSRCIVSGKVPSSRPKKSSYSSITFCTMHSFLLFNK